MASIPDPVPTPTRVLIGVLTGPERVLVTRPADGGPLRFTALGGTHPEIARNVEGLVARIRRTGDYPDDGALLADLPNRLRAYAWAEDVSDNPQYAPQGGTPA